MFGIKIIKTFSPQEYCTSYLLQFLPFKRYNRNYSAILATLQITLYVDSRNSS